MSFSSAPLLCFGESELLCGTDCISPAPFFFPPLQLLRKTSRARSSGFLYPETTLEANRETMFGLANETGGFFLYENAEAPQ
jgi:hypothetical protein